MVQHVSCSVKVLSVIKHASSKKMGCRSWWAAIMPTILEKWHIFDVDESRDLNRCTFLTTQQLTGVSKKKILNNGFRHLLLRLHIMLASLAM